MAAIRRILVAVKELQGKSHPAVLKAAQIARATGARVELFHSLATPLYADVIAIGDAGPGGVARELRHHALHRLQEIADTLRQHSIAVTVAAEWDYPVYEAIVRRALRVRADLIVVSRHAGRHTAPWLLRLTDWELVRLSPVPLLLVKNPHAYRHPAVMAAIDPTHAFAKPLQLDKDILQMGRALSKGLHGTLHAVHAYARLPTGAVPIEAMTPGTNTVRALRKIEQQAKRSAEANFTRAIGALRISRTRRYLIASQPIDAILEATRKSRSSIVVMGAIARSGFRNLLIGNTAERILDELDCDILVVKPRKFRNRVPSGARGARVLMSSPVGALGYY